MNKEMIFGIGLATITIITGVSLQLQINKNNDKINRFNSMYYNLHNLFIDLRKRIIDIESEIAEYEECEDSSSGEDSN